MTRSAAVWFSCLLALSLGSPAMARDVTLMSIDAHPTAGKSDPGAAIAARQLASKNYGHFTVDRGATPDLDVGESSRIRGGAGRELTVELVSESAREVTVRIRILNNGQEKRSQVVTLTENRPLLVRAGTRGAVHVWWVVALP